MIITKTPFRMSFAGGGTDLPAFFKQEEGAVLSTAVDKYMYITVNKRFDRTLRVSYSKTEIVSDIKDLQHDLVREALKWVGIKDGIEITSIADLPAGSGMGSSSSFTVGILHALYAYRGIYKTAAQLAEDACTIEIEAVGEPIGKQDQYAAAFGGMNLIRFMPDGQVFVEPIIFHKETRVMLNDRLMFFYTGETRDTHDILKQQQKAYKQSRDSLVKMRDLAFQLKRVLTEGKDLSLFGEILDKGWQLKRSLASVVSNDRIDNAYARAKEAGAVGGKVLGAGGGGFLLLYVEPENHKKVADTLKDLRQVSFQFESRGSHVIYVEV